MHVCGTTMSFYMLKSKNMCTISKSLKIFKLCKNGYACATYTKEGDSTVVKPPTQAQVVICGAGVLANSVAYHLVSNGVTEVLLIDKGSICGGTSHFGSGLLGLFKSVAERSIVLYSLKLYRQFQARGFDIGLRQCGSLNLAQHPDRIVDLKRKIAYNIPTGLHCEILSPSDVKKLHPFLNVEDLKGAAWVPEDATANSSAICKTFAELSIQGGAQYVENCNVELVVTENGKVKGIQTDRGFISCEYFINCAGMWARELGWLCSTRIRVPVYPAEHFYVSTDPLPGITRDLPCVRDFDSSLYMREYNNGIMLGGYEPVAKPAFINYRLIPKDWKSTLPADWDHFMPIWEKACNRIPILKDVINPKLINSPDTFTPDGRWIIGETPEVKNYFVAVGMNGNSIQSAGGIGKAIAEWIITGEPTQDILPFDVRRFIDLHNNRQYLQERTKEIVGRRYSINYPLHNEYKTARNLRSSPLYCHLKQRGATFETRMGYERPMYFNSIHESGMLNRIPSAPSFYQPDFFPLLLNEYNACNNGVGIIDMSTLSKTRISGSHSSAVNWLQKLCSNDVNIPVGGIVHTGMQNEKGGYENDCVLVRESEDKYLMISPTSQQTICFHWMNRWLPDDGSIHLKDVTSMYSVINIVGKRAKNLLSDLSTSKIDLHPFTYKTVNIGYASEIMMMSFTHTGEQGFSLYIPSDYAIYIYDKLIEMNSEYDVRNIGSITQRFMRIERFIPFWAEDLNSHTTPFECGNGYKVKLDKEYFIGKFALQKQKNEGVTKRLVLFELMDLNPSIDLWTWGMEPIFRNNEFVGQVTSAGYSFIRDRLVCLGYVRQPSSYREKYTRNRQNMIVTNNFIMDHSAKYEIDVAGRRFVARPHISPKPFKPTSTSHSYYSSIKKPCIIVPRTLNSS